MSFPTEIINEPTVFVANANKVILYSDFVSNLFKHDTPDMEHMHAALGVAGEAGELADAIKKHVVYGKELDRANIVEELGDLRFYMQQIMNMHGITEEEVLQGNATKLNKRYKSGSYSNEAAIARADKVEQKPVATVRFCHDLEDGWYYIKYPNGSYKELNHWKDMKTHIIDNKVDAVWVGDEQYKPKDFDTFNA